MWSLCQQIDVHQVKSFQGKLKKERIEDMQS
jgi:hypothetical protein